MSEVKESLNSLRRHRIDLVHELNLTDQAIKSMEKILGLEPGIKKTAGSIPTKENKDTRNHSHRQPTVKIDACCFPPCSKSFMARRKDAKACCLAHDKFNYFEKRPDRRPTDWKGNSPYAWKNMYESMVKSGIDADKADAYMKQHAGLVNRANADTVKHETVVRTHKKHPAVLLPGDALSKR